jgi:hypothetical protein
MPVRFEDNTGANNVPADGTRRRNTKKLVMVALPVALLVVGLGSALLRDKPDSDGGGTTTPSPAPSSSLPLPAGDAVAGGGGTRPLFGVSTGYAHDQAGATSAAINYDAAAVGKGMWSKDSRAAINNYIYTKAARGSAITDEQAVQVEKATGLNDNGQAVNPDGTVSATNHLYADCYPKYGAYRVLDTTGSKSAPDSVKVQIWRPCLFGVGSEQDTSRVQIRWSWVTKTVSWTDGDWRISQLENAATAAPAPDPARKINPTFAERAKLLGTKDGWTLPANASEAFDSTIGLPKP